MRLLIASIVIGPLMLIGAPPAAAAQPVSTGPQTQSPPAPGTSSADRDTYTQKAQRDLQDWQQKVHDFTEKAKARGQQASNAVAADLNVAWTKTRDEARKMQAAGAEGWDRARASYERASHDLADTWNRIRPEDR